MLNRLAVVVSAKQPLVEWVRFNDPDADWITLESAADDATIYLLPQIDYPADYGPLIAAVWASIFEDQLMQWYSDDDLWPRGRTLEMFQQWFDCKYHSTIVDLSTRPLIDDEL